MAYYEVVAGDSPDIIAHKFGLYWDAIWFSSKNFALRALYDDDGTKLQPGDNLYVPETLDVSPSPGSGTTLRLPRDREFFLKRAYKKAFGAYDPDDWDPEAGFAANRPRILKLYDYYASLYAAFPTRFYWAGLGKLAGGAVISGMDLLLGMRGESTITRRMVRIGKEIFHDLAWCHEAFLESQRGMLALARERDRDSPKPKESFENAWSLIVSSDGAKVFDGNCRLLANEQFTVIQPHYDALRKDPKISFEFNRTRAFTRSVHPYHRRFQLVFPLGDVLDQNDRWRWITEADGMWAKFTTMPSEHRDYLVALPMEKVLKQQWGEDKIIPSLLPPGAYDAEDQS